MGDAGTLIVLAGIIGIAFAFFLFYKVSLISVQPSDSGTTLKTLKRMAGNEQVSESSEEKVFQIYQDIRDGAKSFLQAEYTMCGYFLVIFGAGCYNVLKDAAPAVEKKKGKKVSTKKATKKKAASKSPSRSRSRSKSPSRKKKTN